MVYENGTQTASILDKTDWRRTIHKCLEECVLHEDTLRYPQTVKSLISAVSATYPSFDAEALINKYISELKEKYRKDIKEYILKNPDNWYHPGKRNTIEPQIVNDYYKDIFTFIKNLCATKRMLLWGSAESEAIGYDDIDTHGK